MTTEKETVANQIEGMCVRFIPKDCYREVSEDSVFVQKLSDVDSEWNKWKDDEKDAEPKI